MINNAMNEDDPVRDPGGSVDGRPPGAPESADDPMGPPKEPCECWCMHCNRTFMSTEMWFQRVVGDPQGFKGFWMCPTPNCGGAGFCFDVFPTDPDHPANEGWHSTDDEVEGEYDPESDLDLIEADAISADSSDTAWDPDEANWKELDDEVDDDEDIEGEEWKLGLAPGERPPEPEWVEQDRREREEEEKQYDEPDRRPRELDWSDRDEPRPVNRPRGDDWREDDIPF